MKPQEKAYLAGYRDYLKGVDKSRNPYQYSSNIFMEASWTTGWQAAEKENGTPST